MDLLSFYLDDQLYALPLTQVRRALPAVAIAPLPKGPASIIGVVNVAGAVIPVVDLRGRLQLPSRELNVSDRLLWVVAAGRDLLLPVDRVDTVLHLSSAAILAADTLPETPELLQGVACLPQGILLIEDLTEVLNLQERRALDNALVG